MTRAWDHIRFWHRPYPKVINVCKFRYLTYKQINIFNCSSQQRHLTNKQIVLTLKKGRIMKDNLNKQLETNSWQCKNSSQKGTNSYQSSMDNHHHSLTNKLGIEIKIIYKTHPTQYSNIHADLIQFSHLQILIRGFNFAIKKHFHSNMHVRLINNHQFSSHLQKVMKSVGFSTEYTQQHILWKPTTKVWGW